MPQLRILVVDDSLVFRSLLMDCINSTPQARVISFASDGKEAIEKALQYKPDVITLDIEMPVMNGLEALVILRRELPESQIVMISSSTTESARQTIQALESGAMGFIAKTDLNDPELNKEVLKKQFGDLIQEIIVKQSVSSQPVTQPPAQTASLRSFTKPEIIAIGVSTGGPQALAAIIPKLPATLKVPVVIVQHMPAIFTASLAESLLHKSKVKVVEAQHSMQLASGTVYIAPGGTQMRLTTKIDISQVYIELTDDPAENFCKPSVDYLFRSVASVYKSKAMGIILTGMGKDGTQGLKLMKMYGAKIIGQDAATCTVYGMPREAKAAGVVDVELPVDSIADEIVRCIQ